ncbi:hypothetical protein K439DRAFT_1619344 [Ramaria rubella]|nr:hypothetical protein K439DRAFT_1619344 [Ramaria rubella]
MTQVAFSARVICAFDSDIITRDLQPARLQERSPSSPTSPEIKIETRPKLKIKTNTNPDSSRKHIPHEPPHIPLPSISPRGDSPSIHVGHGSQFRFPIRKATEAHSAPVTKTGGFTFPEVSPQEGRSRSAPVTPQREKSPTFGNNVHFTSFLEFSPEEGAIPEKSFLKQESPKQESPAIPESSTLGGLPIKGCGRAIEDGQHIAPPSFVSNSISAWIARGNGNASNDEATWT